MNTRLSVFEKEESENLYKNHNYNFIDIARKLGRDERSIRGYLNKIGYKAKSQSELQRKYPIVENFFDEINTEEKAYILGLLYADGYNNTDKNEVCISLKEDDVEILNRITEIIQPTKPLFYLDMSPDNRGMKNSKNQYRITINNKHISQKLVELGCGKAKSSILVFPSDIQVSNSLINHFIRGYFDGDGSVSKGKNPKIDIISTPEFLIPLQKILNNILKIGITKLNTKGHHSNANVTTLQIGGKLQCIRFGDWIYKDATIYLERKKKVFDEYYKKKLIMNATPEGMYTEQQINYVNSVKDEQLRSHLLHQVRLRDIMEQDRDAFERDIFNKNSIKHAVKIPANALKTDESYRIGWQANIAMAFKDEFYRTNPDLKSTSEYELHIIANQASNNFLNLLCEDATKN